MKCIKIHSSHFGTTGKCIIVRRVTDDEAFNLVYHGPWLYANRTEWKLCGRKWGVSKDGTNYVPPGKRK